jgi:hypothetical protein
MLTLPADATHVLIGQLTRFFKAEHTDQGAWWLVYSPTLNKWVKLYSASSRRGSSKNIAFPNVRQHHHFVPLDHPLAREHLYKTGVITEPRLPTADTIPRTGPIIISEENLRQIIIRSFETGYLTGCAPATCKEHLEMQCMDASSALRVKSPGFVQSMVDWFDDRPKLRDGVRSSVLTYTPSQDILDKAKSGVNQ